MSTEDKKIAPSEQFRQSAEALAVNMSLVLRAAEARDEAEIMVGKLEGLVLGARAELKVRQDAYERSREITGAQSQFYLSVMEGEAKENIANLRPVKAATADPT